MKTSESISNLTKALVKAQAAMGAAVKGAKNPFFKSNYSDLPTVMEVVKGPLNENGLLVLQPSAHRDGKNFIDTVIIHGESGEYISSETEVICSKANDAQNFGAGQTYARRFGLQALLFIPSEDDDGNTATGNTSKSSYTPAKPIPEGNNSVNWSKPTSKADPVALAQAAASPATTSEVANDDAKPFGETTVAPLQKSSFRKPAKASAPATVAALANPPVTDGEWA